jgi:hypothetical protein
MLNVATINNENIGEVEIISKEIFTDYFDRQILIHNIDKQKYLDYLKYKPALGFDYVVNYIELKPLFRITSKVDDKYMVIPLFTKPIEFSLMNYEQYGAFRLFADIPYIGVNERGIIYNLKTDKFISPRVTKYKTISLGNIDISVNRLVAFEWCNNDDYVKNYVVDHINQDKLDNYYKNLRWLSNKANVSRSHSYNNGVAIDKRWMVYSSKFNKIFEFTGLKEIDLFFNINYRNIEARKFPFLYQLPNKDVLLFEDRQNFNNWKLKKKIPLYGYRYSAKNKRTGIIRYFRILDDVLKAFGLTEQHCTKLKTGNTFDCIRLSLLKKDVVLKDISTIKIYNQSSTDKYNIEAKNLKTNEIIVKNSTRELGEHFGVGKSIFIFRLNGNIREGLPFIAKDGSQWLIRKSNEEWPEVIEPKKVIKKIGYFVKGSLVRTYDSVREAGRDLNLGRGMLTTMLKDEKDVTFKYIG